MEPDLEREIRFKLNVPLKTARKVLNLGDRAARNAIARGEIPTTDVGRNINIPTVFLRRKSGIEPA